MELLYIWINKTKSNFLKKIEFNFSPNITFKLNEVENNKSVLSYTTIGEYNIFSNPPIRNITAIVGKNGSGKTTLLSYIYKNMMPYKATEKNNSDYDAYNQETSELEESIWAFKNNNELQVYFTNPDLVVGKGLTPYLISKDTISDLCYRSEPYHDRTILYLTNSLYTYDLNGFSIAEERLDHCCLSPASIKVLSKAFYNSITGLDSGVYNAMNLRNEFRESYNSFYFLQGTIISTKNELDFQQVCDLLYYHELVSKELIDTYKGKINIEFIVHCNPLLNIIDREYPEFINHEPKDYKGFISKLCTIYYDFKRETSKKHLFITIIFLIIYILIYL